MRIGPTADRQPIQAPLEWAKAKPCLPTQRHAAGGAASEWKGTAPLSKAPGMGIRKASPDPISA